MNTFATISEVSLRITGSPQSGWEVAGASDPTSTMVIFSFAITDDGGGNFLLCCWSPDPSYFADSWHDTLDSAFNGARDTYGIDRSEWCLKS